MSILDYYKYALLSTGAYVRMGGKSLDGSTFADEASSLDQAKGRLPSSIGQYLFDPNNIYGNQNVWSILYYYGGDKSATVDPIASADASGFAATLFSQTTMQGTTPVVEKVLAIRGTEPFKDLFADLGQDLGGLATLGLALSQVVSMVNLIQRLKGTKDLAVRQLKVSASLTQPTGGNFVTAQGELGVPVYLVFDTYNAAGLEVIKAGEKITVTGHSLGGHLAMFAAWLFPEIVNDDVYLYNTPGYDPEASNILGALPGATLALKAYLVSTLGLEAALIDISAQKLTDEVVALLDLYLLDNSASTQGKTFHLLESENLAPGDDLSLVSSFLTNQQSLGQPTYVATEANSHVIEPMTDSLALQALVATMNSVLSLEDMRELLLASAEADKITEERKSERGQAWHIA